MNLLFNHFYDSLEKDLEEAYPIESKYTSLTFKPSGSDFGDGSDITIINKYILPI